MHPKFYFYNKNESIYKDYLIHTLPCTSNYSRTKTKKLIILTLKKNVCSVSYTHLTLPTRVAV